MSCLWEGWSKGGLTLRELLALSRPRAVVRLVAIHADVKVLPDLGPSHGFCDDAGGEGSDHEAGDLVEGNHCGTIVEVSVVFCKNQVGLHSLRYISSDSDGNKN